MTNVEEQEDTPMVERKPWVPQVIQGGKGPPDEPSDNWLEELLPGHTFVCRQNKKSVDFELYHVLYHADGMMLLKWSLPDGKFWDRYVDTKMFSNLYRDHKVLGYVNPQEALEFKGDKDGKPPERDRPD